MTHEHDQLLVLVARSLARVQKRIALQPHADAHGRIAPGKDPIFLMAADALDEATNAFQASRLTASPKETTP